MRKLIVYAVAAVILVSCGTAQPVKIYGPLYYWGGSQVKMNSTTSIYEDLAYKNYRQKTPQITCSLICAYEDMVQNPGGMRKVPPPGICAEYGYLLMIPESASTFAENATEKQKKVFAGQDGDYRTLFSRKAGEMFELEMKYYPESQVFIKPLVEKLRNR